MDATRLEAEREEYRRLAVRCEARAREALLRGDRGRWEHWAHAADRAWLMNQHVVGELDRIAG